MLNIKKYIKDILDVTAEGGTAIMGECLKDALIGQVAPGAVTMFMSYRQKRAEKMVVLALEELRERASRLEAYVYHVNDEQKNIIKEKILPLIFDYVIEEVQEEKINYIINGFENIIEDLSYNEDLTYMYYDVLRQLRFHELHFFIKYYKPKNWNQGRELIQEFKELEEKYLDIHWIHIAKRLEQLGLIKIGMTAGLFDDKDAPLHPDIVKISKFGKEFLRFFRDRK